MAKPTPLSRTGKRSRPGKNAPADPPPGPAFLPPLRPHRKLFVISAVLVAACLAAWLTIYFTTVRQ
jgi:hypothetical protein